MPHRGYDPKEEGKDADNYTHTYAEWWCNPLCLPRRADGGMCVVCKDSL